MCEFEFKIEYSFIYEIKIYGFRLRHVYTFMYNLTGTSICLNKF